MAAIADPEAPPSCSITTAPGGRSISPLQRDLQAFPGHSQADQWRSEAALGANATVKLLRCGEFFWRDLHMSDRPVRYGMIVLDAAPTIVRVRGTPIIFRSPEETVEYAQLH